MYGLWLFGIRLEYLLGLRRFAIYYLSCVRDRPGPRRRGLPRVGRVGVLLACGLTFLETRLLLLFPPTPIKAKRFVLI